MAMNGTFTRAATFVAMLLATAPSLLGQTVVKPPKNKFNPQQDVDLPPPKGRQHRGMAARLAHGVAVHSPHHVAGEALLDLRL